MLVALRRLQGRAGAICGANVAAIRQARKPAQSRMRAFTPGSAARHGGRAADRDPDCPAAARTGAIAPCNLSSSGSRARAGLARSQCYARGDRPAGPSASCADPAEYRLPSGLSRGGEPRLLSQNRIAARGYELNPERPFSLSCSRACRSSRFSCFRAELPAAWMAPAMFSRVMPCFPPPRRERLSRRRAACKRGRDSQQLCEMRR